MAIKIKFDGDRHPRQPTLILATKAGERLGIIPATKIHFRDSLSSYSEFSFEVEKNSCRNMDDSINEEFWDAIKDFRLMYCREFDMWYELTVEVRESNDLVKVVSAISLGEAELSQINLYELQFNTEDDIARDDYKPTVMYSYSDKSVSLIDRLLKKAPHYTVGHIDSDLINIQRTYSFDSISIYDAFQQIAEEIECLFRFECGLDSDHKIERKVNIYDLKSHCADCGTRGYFTTVCDACGSENVIPGYGNDTPIFVSADNLTDEIRLTPNTDEVKNCFRIVGGDDLMTATVANCSPNGTTYLWYISDSMREDMSDELNTKLDDYIALYNYYQTDDVYTPDSSLRSSYNSVAASTQTYHSEAIPLLEENYTGYPNMMIAYYNAIDLHVLLQSSLMPTPSISAHTAETEANRIYSGLSIAAVTNLSYASAATVTNAVTSVAKSLIDGNFKVSANMTSYSSGAWYGTFTVENYHDEEDIAETRSIAVTITDDYELYLRQSIERTLANESDDVTDIVGLFALSESTFQTELHKYSLSRLMAFHDAARGAVDIMIQNGVGTDTDDDIYSGLYLPYYNKMGYVEAEIQTRENSISVVDALMDDIEEHRNEIQNALNLESFIGDDLQSEFASFRREQEYRNDNYISDGLDNAELFAKAEELRAVAQVDIEKAAEVSHTISSSLYNLLVIPGFSSVVEYFSVGNWIREEVDGEIYKLRLTDYEIDYDDISKLEVTFTDTKKNRTDIGDIDSILSKASSISTTYGVTQRQAKNGNDTKQRVRQWMTDGLALTQMKIVNTADRQDITWDEHGMLLREYDPFTDSYDDRQAKIISRGLYLTDDNWRTVNVGLGDVFIYNPETMEYEERYGLIAETVVAPIVLSENVGIYTEGNNISLNKDGICVYYTDESTGLTMRVVVDPSNTDGVFVISREINQEITNVLGVDAEGNAYIAGNIYAMGGTIGGFTITDSCLYNGKPSMSAYANGVYLGIDGIALGNTFWVTRDGELSATRATITGHITANSGSIGCVQINNDGSISTPYFSVDARGYLRAVNADISGRITATSGQIGNLTINQDGSISTNYFSVDANGYLKATNAEINGKIVATSGTIGGFTIGETALYNGLSTLDGNADGVYLGTNGISLGGGNFKVTNAGALTAKSGKIGGFTIGTDSLYCVATDDDSVVHQVYLRNNGIELGDNIFKVTDTGVMSLDGAINLYRNGTSIGTIGAVHDSFQNSDGIGILHGNMVLEMQNDILRVDGGNGSSGTVFAYLNGSTGRGAIHANNGLSISTASLLLQATTEDSLRIGLTEGIPGGFSSCSLAEYIVSKAGGLGITGASANDFVIIKTVDSNGAPTSYDAITVEIVNSVQF